MNGHDRRIERVQQAIAVDPAGDLSPDRLADVAAPSRLRLHALSTR